MKLNKQKLCAVATITYHLLFLGGGTTLVNGYLEEIAKLKQEIVRQADRADKLIADTKKDADNMVKRVEKVGQTLDTSVKSINTQLKKAEKACKKLRF